MKFIDKTIKYILCAIGVIVTLMVVVHSLIIDCTTDELSLITLCQDPPGWFSLFGILLSLLVAALFAYGLVRVIYWPHGPRSNVTYRITWIIAGIAGCLIAILTFFAFALAAYGI